MDCPACQGNGEIEYTTGIEEQKRNERTDIALDRASRPDACPVCGGNGALEEPP
jgi:DnaJ-class molecular chaperone